MDTAAVNASTEQANKKLLDEVKKLFDESRREIMGVMNAHMAELVNLIEASEAKITALTAKCEMALQDESNEDSDDE